LYVGLELAELAPLAAKMIVHWRAAAIQCGGRRAARERKFQIDGTMFAREGRKT
jgi:hypothetical protein